MENVKKELQKYDFRPFARKPANVIADHLDQVLGTVRDTLLKVKTSVKKSTEQQYSQNVIAMKGKLKNMFKRAKKTKNVALLARCKLFEKQIRGEIIRIKKLKCVLKQILEEITYGKP